MPRFCGAAKTATNRARLVRIDLVRTFDGINSESTEFQWSSASNSDVLVHQQRPVIIGPTSQGSRDHRLWNADGHTCRCLDEADALFKSR